MDQNCLRSTTYVTPTETAFVITYPIFTGLERIILTSDGNLQRTMSAYFNEVVVLELLKFKQIGGDGSSFEREIVLKCKNKVFCNARTRLSVTSDTVLSLLQDKGMGFGQLFTFLKAQPVFKLLDCQKDKKALWRHYKLEIPGMICIITEVFPVNLFTLDLDSPVDEFTADIWEAIPQWEGKQETN